jgi:phosphoglucomutase/phosphomannomutase
VLGVEFPERGFLLFWQLELEDKLRYFEIEDEIAALRDLEDAQAKQQRLDELLDFLGADPVDKVDQAFAANYGTEIRDYLGL